MTPAPPIPDVGFSYPPPESLGRRLRSGGGWSLIGRVAAVATGLGTSALLARLVSPAEVGTYLLAVSVVSVGALLGGLGLNQVLVRRVAESAGGGRTGPDWPMIWTIFRITGAGAGVVSALYLIGGDVVTEKLLHSAGLAAITLPLAAWIVVLAAQNAVTETFRGLGDIRSAALWSGPLQGCLLVLFLAGALNAGRRLSLEIVVLAALGSAWIGASLGWLVLKRRSRRVPVTSARASRIAVGATMRVAAPLLATNLLFIAFTQADLWVVAAFLPEDQVGVYGTAARIAAVVSMPLLVVAGVLAPMIAELSARGRTADLQRLVRATTAAAVIPAAVLAGVFVLAGGPLLRIVYGEEYSAGAFILAVLATGQLMHVLGGPCGLTLAMTGGQRELAAVTVAVTGLLVPCALVLATRAHGTTGAALAFAGGIAVQNVAWVLTARYATGVWTHASFSELSAVVRRSRGRERPC